MPSLRVRVTLPYALALAAGNYPTSPAGEVVVIAPTPAAGDGVAPAGLDQPRPSTVATTAAVDDAIPPHAVAPAKRRRCEKLVRHVNRLLRWYRAVTKRVGATELTMAMAGPFEFEAVGGTLPDDWLTPITFEAVNPQPVLTDEAAATAAVRAGLATGGEPDVADLFLLDAEQAYNQGRFREAVLFSWSTIDAVFNRRYDALVDQHFAGEWGEARDFFKGFEFKLRNKMTAGLSVVAGRSLFREPGDLWPRLSASYAKRNAIIHRGDAAGEADATQAIGVARRVREVMHAL